jgi:sigma-B regulation protein RsbU (phosphoserine phosphatase)
MDIGERLLLYTDGAYETRALDGEEYGRERLLAAAAQAGHGSVEEWPHLILADLQGFVGTGEFTDDLCLLCIERGAWPSAGGGT